MKFLLKYALLALHRSDQFLRTRLEHSRRSFFARKLLWYVIILLDGVNQLVLQFIIGHFGWPGKTKYGVQASEAAFYVVIHGNRKYIEKYIGALSDAVCAGEAEMRHLGMMMDRLLMYRGKKQIYGSQMQRLGNSVHYSIYPIVSASKVNERRKKAGFPDTLEEYAKANQAVIRA